MEPPPLRTLGELHAVNRWSRIALGCLAVFSVWQIVWLFKARDNVEGAIPDVQGVNLWVVLWAIVGVTCTAGAVIGKDAIARIGFGAMAVVSSMGAVTVLIATKNTDVVGCTMIGQFYSFGQAALLAALSFDMLLSPLRALPQPPGSGWPHGWN